MAMNSTYVQLTILLLSLLQLHSLPVFQVYWNVPSDDCLDVRPELFNITTNTGHHFVGDKLVIFYSFGALPYCNEAVQAGLNNEESECDHPMNGGAANLSIHLTQIENDINEKIPNEQFDGLAIIDWEAWRPIFELNHSSRRVYQRYSRYLAQQHCENCTDKQIDKLAHEEFEQGAKDFMLITLSFARALRPSAKWGFWEYPLCNDDVGYTTTTQCSVLHHAANKKLMWLYEATDILLPKIYFYNVSSQASRRQYHVYGELHQAQAINRALEPHKKPIFAYAKLEYKILHYFNVLHTVNWNEATETIDDYFYSKIDVCNTLKYPYELGVDGVIIWGSSYHMNDRCDLMTNYLNELFGPFASIVVGEAIRCSEVKCKGCGRCVADDSSPPKRCQLGEWKSTHCEPI
ncbi:Hyaluronidase [Aphelenchoides besseyi]|nr:Hyaluronidase [Aphelenchoides besseyi]KAI6221626.1 Hyaluronidase [Aphelenchoides besseyi]